MYLRTKHIALPYHLFWYKSKALKIEVLSINTNDHLADQFAKGLQEGNFELAPKALIKWYLIKGGGQYIETFITYLVDPDQLGVTFKFELIARSGRTYVSYWHIHFLALM